MKYYLGLLLLVLSSCGVLSAQTKSQTDLSVPGEEHQKLNVLAGDWDVIVRIPVGPGRTVEGRSTCEAKWVMDGRFLRQEYSSVFGGKPLTVVRYLGYDRHKGEFVELQFESTHTDVMHNKGKMSADGKSINSLGTAIDLTTGREANVRTVTTIIDTNTFTLELHYADPISGETKTLTLTHKRRKG